MGFEDLKPAEKERLKTDLEALTEIVERNRRGLSKLAECSAETNSDSRNNIGTAETMEIEV
jgi:hypothetical protein